MFISFSLECVLTKNKKIQILTNYSVILAKVLYHFCDSFFSFILNKKIKKIEKEEEKKRKRKGRKEGKREGRKDFDWMILKFYSSECKRCFTLN